MAGGFSTYLFFPYGSSSLADTGEFSEKAIQASLLNYFATNFSETSNIEYDEEPFDPEGKSEWVQVDVTVFDSLVRRRTGKERQSVRITAHCWAETGTNLYRAFELADQVCAVFGQSYIEIQDFGTSGDPIVGGCNINEPQVEDLTRELHEENLVGWQHVMVTLEGEAQEL